MLFWERFGDSNVFPSIKICFAVTDAWEEWKPECADLKFSLRTQRFEKGVFELKLKLESQALQV